VTIASTSNKHIYNGDDTTVNWPYTFPIISNTDIKVYLTSPALVETEQTTNFTVDENNLRVVYPTTGDPLPTGWKITLLRKVPLTQETDLKNQGPLPAEVIEAADDKAMMAIQQVNEKTDRSVLWPVSSSPSSQDSTAFLETVVGYKADALAAKTAAETAETNAETAETNAETAQGLAETAKTGAETAQGLAETAQGLAETARTGAETAETNAETAETNAETAQGLAETAKTGAETAQGLAETAQGLAETAKTGAETAETNAETAETNAETAETNAVTAKNLAQDWAVKTDAIVAATDYSAKEYAQGSQAGAGGSAKNWAQAVGAYVTEALCSAKEWAIGTFTRGATGGGSAKDWATLLGATVDNVEYSARKYAADAAASAANITYTPVFQARATLASGVPVTTTDQLAKTTLYLTPFRGNRVALFDGSIWNLYALAEISIAVPATTSTMYDIFVYSNAGTLMLELLAWTNDTTRATALTTQDGVLVKTGATTRRYVGSFRTTTASGQTEDSSAKRYLWNYYNRVKKYMEVNEPTDTWNYTTATIRQANGNAANQLDMVIGVSEDIVAADVVGAAGSQSVGVEIAVGVGLDVTNAFAGGQLHGAVAILAASSMQGLHATWKGYVGIGRHYLAWLEYSAATGTTTWIGDLGFPLRCQSGIYGELFC